METISITPGWHKATDPFAMTYKQLELISSLLNEENCPEWPFRSGTNAMRSLTKADASAIIDALKDGKKIVFKY